MITLYSGTPGSGKSLHAVSDMLRYDKRGWPVISNFALNRAAVRNPDRVISFDNAELLPGKLMEYASHYWKSQGTKVVENRILLVVDECQLVFNARDWQRNKEWVSFFTQHRKAGFSVILVAQNREMIDKQIRAVLEFEFKHRTLTTLGVFGRLLSIVMGSRFLYRKELAQVRTLGKGMSVGWSLGHYGKRVFRAYDTFQTW